MGLSNDDPRPNGITLRDAYSAIRNWYQANVDRLAADPQVGEHAVAAKSYIHSMPAPGKASQDDMVDACRRVIYRDLEWAYHESDGKYKMAAYAYTALEGAGISPIA